MSIGLPGDGNNRPIAPIAPIARALHKTTNLRNGVNLHIGVNSVNMRIGVNMHIGVNV